MPVYKRLVILIGLWASLSQSGCKYMNPHVTITIEKYSLDHPSYPKDHVLTPEERKDLTNEFLERKEVPVAKYLPTVLDYHSARFRPAKEAAGKAVVLYGLVNVAYHKKTAVEMITYFKKYDLWKYVSPKERAYLEKEIRTKEDDNTIGWRIENLNVFLWAFGIVDSLPFPTAMCNLHKYKDLPDLKSDPSSWINKQKPRNEEEVLNELDLIYRIHWAVRDAALNNKPIPAGLNEDVIMERHFALNWLTMYKIDWDDITTDT